MRGRPDIVVVLVAIFIVGTLGLNFVLFIASMVGTEFGMDAGAFGLMNSVMAVGSVTGALLAARRGRPRLRLVFGAAGGFGVASGLAALAPGRPGTCSRGALRADHDHQRQWVCAVHHGPGHAGSRHVLVHGHLHGWDADRGTAGGMGRQCGRPRWSLAVAATAGLAAAVVGIVWIVRAQQLRLRFDRTARGWQYLRLVPRRTMQQQGPRSTMQNGAAQDSLRDDAA